MIAYLVRLAARMGLNVPETVGLLVTFFVGALFAVVYACQYFYLLVSCVRKPKKYPETGRENRYAAIIAARNEEAVIGSLIASIKAQDYPAHLIEIFVVADNCTDATAARAREAGAVVYERHNEKKRGKGYALEFLFDRIQKTRGLRAFDAYLIFDADNVLRENFFSEMDKAYSAGNRIITSYRNSKNYGTNWISAGYALWYLHESRHLNNARSLLGTSAAVSGTGFLVASEIIEKNGGWRHFLLTEDIEFTVDEVLAGERIGYCHEAELFDEQPETFRESWRQRKRWAKGFFQVFGNYGGRLFFGMLHLRWACFDMMMSVMPALVLSVFQILTVMALFVANLLLNGVVSGYLLRCILGFFLFAYGLVIVFGVFAVVSEWRRIHCNKGRALALLLTFPIFMMTYLPIAVSALFSTTVEWQPTKHKHVMDARDIETTRTSKGE